MLRKQDGRDPSDLVGLCPHRVSNRLLDGHHLDAGSCSRHCILQPFGNCLATRLQACRNDNNHLSWLSVGLLINSRISANLVWSPLPCAVHLCLVPQRCALLCQYLLDGHKLDSELWSRRFHVLGNRLRSIMSGVSHWPSHDTMLTAQFPNLGRAGLEAPLGFNCTYCSSCLGCASVGVPLRLPCA